MKPTLLAVADCDLSEALQIFAICVTLAIGSVIAACVACLLAPDNTRKCDPYPDAWDEDGKWEEGDE